MGYLQRSLWLGTLLWGAIIPWLSIRPPLIDLPQHAGQIALLFDYFSSDPNWANLVAPNFITPYLITYSLIFLLSQFFSILVAIKIVLSISYVGFMAACIVLRREFNSNPQLDWLFLIGYFGFAWIFGFISFLFAAPIGLLLIWATCRFLSSATVSRAMLMVAIGVALILSHGLMFGFIFLICLGIFLQNALLEGFSFKKCLPFSSLFVGCILFLGVASYLQPKDINDGFAFGKIFWNYDFVTRVKEFFIYPLDQTLRWGLPLVLIMMVTPFLLSARFNALKNPSLIAFTVFFGVFFLAPTFALKIQYLYQRFSIFLLPFFAFLFRAEVKSSEGNKQSAFNSFIAKALMIGCVWTQYWTTTLDIRAFSKESQVFESLLDSLEPGGRALYLPINAESDAQNRDNIYLHYGQWYQAEKNGFVDFSFAWTPAMIMRFIDANPNPIKPGFEWEPAKFSWQKHNGDFFRYFIIKSKKEIDPVIFFDGSSCIPNKVFKRGEWQVYEKALCSKS